LYACGLLFLFLLLVTCCFSRLICFELPLPA
jgi:hypothetical protein